MKTIELGEYELKVHLAEYTNGRLAVILVDVNSGELYGLVTVNLPDSTIQGKDTSYLDTNNSQDLIDKFVELGLVKILDSYKYRSGWCTYPLGKFNLEKLKEYSDQEEK